jgi:hypothetical protein
MNGSVYVLKLLESKKNVYVCMMVWKVAVFQVLNTLEGCHSIHKAIENAIFQIAKAIFKYVDNNCLVAIGHIRRSKFVQISQKTQWLHKKRAVARLKAAARKDMKRRRMCRLQQQPFKVLEEEAVAAAA